MKKEPYEVIIRLVANRRPCHSGHRIGDEWVFNYFTPPGMCSLAFNALYPLALALQFGATFPWQQDPDVITVACPDPEVNNIFELRRRPLSAPDLHER